MRLPVVRQASCALVVAALAAAAPALADDLADEADLQFRIGAERYTAGDYRGALEHFLASNRLVKNRNVAFNVARTYEKLAQYPEAFRYYTAALAAEPDAAARARIEAAIAAIRPHVVILNVSTQPPGATLYVDRKDLGPRGESPLGLAVVPGKYRVIAELPGHRPAEAEVERTELGQSADVTLVLRPILGKLRVEGVTGARVHLDGATEGLPVCLLPCSLDLPPGRHRVHLSLTGYRSMETTADVVENAEVVVHPAIEPLTGIVVVATDEPGALITVDGRSRGFTPAILTLPVGPHDLVVSREGFSPATRAVTVTTDAQVKIDLALERAEEVQAVSRMSESVEDAPSSVTIVPREELLAFAYPTVAEAVRGTPGIYLWNDRSYVSLGIRGLGRLGSYSNRELVLLDGHPANDDWIGSAYVGFDGRTDLGDVDHIEVVRGPGSVLYGTNAFSGVINVVSRPSARRPGGEVGVSAVDAGVGRGRVRLESNLGEDGGIWASVSGAVGEGRDFYFPELAGEPSGGISRNADGFEAGTTQGRVYWKWLTAQWFLHSYEKELPTGAFDTLLGDPRTLQTDTRSFVEVRAEPVLSKEVQLLSRVHLNHYRFRGDYARDPADGGVEHDSFDGSWVGLEQRVVITPTQALRLTAGGEGQFHYQVDTRAEDDAGPFLDETGPSGRDYRVGAVYGVVDADLTADVRVSAGVRLDAYSTFGTSLNPRGAVILHPYEGGNTKVLGGKAFRAPSIYELYYNDDGFSQIASPDLEPESIYSFEVEHSHDFSPTVTGIAAVYGNYANGLVVSRGEATEEDPLYYVNSPAPLATVGGELSLRREWRQGIMLQVTYGYQHSTFLASSSASDLFSLNQDPSTREVANSPAHLAALKAAVPLYGRLVTGATRLTFESGRYDRNESVDDPAQSRSEAFVTWDLILSGQHERMGVRYAVGAYNVTDTRVSLPVSSELQQTVVEQNGRTFLASVDVAF